MTNAIICRNRTVCPASVRRVDWAWFCTEQGSMRGGRTKPTVTCTFPGLVSTPACAVRARSLPRTPSQTTRRTAHLFLDDLQDAARRMGRGYGVVTWARAPHSTAAQRRQSHLERAQHGHLERVQENGELARRPRSVQRVLAGRHGISFAAGQERRAAGVPHARRSAKDEA